MTEKDVKVHGDDMLHGRHMIEKQVYISWIACYMLHVACYVTHVAKIYADAMETGT